MDGTQVTHVARTGEKIYVYPDGSTKQVDADGSGIIFDEAGERTDFKEGGDAKFEARRLAKDKGPLDESLENVASSTDEEPDSPDDGNQLHNFWSTLKAERAARKAKPNLAHANRARKEKRQNRRMVPRDQPRQAQAAKADLTDFQFGGEDSRMDRRLLANNAATSVASTEYSLDPLEECEPERCCWIDVSPTPRSEYVFGLGLECGGIWSSVRMWGLE